MKRALLLLLIAAALLALAVSWATLPRSDTPTRIPTAPESSVRVIYPKVRSWTCACRMAGMSGSAACSTSTDACIMANSSGTMTPYRSVGHGSALTLPRRPSPSSAPGYEIALAIRN